mmetsp:Transcript_39793/g.124110  ORF Transcript_39793/g.124110 Transcript_39793/m.124110 type:complete len:261 (-) Transcript_39793:12-794(-)
MSAALLSCPQVAPTRRHGDQVSFTVCAYDTLALHGMRPSMNTPRMSGLPALTGGHRGHGCFETATALAPGIWGPGRPNAQCVEFLREEVSSAVQRCSALGDGLVQLGDLGTWHVRQGESAILHVGPEDEPAALPIDRVRIDPPTLSARDLQLRPHLALPAALLDMDLALRVYDAELHAGVTRVLVVQAILLPLVELPLLCGVGLHQEHDDCHQVDSLCLRPREVKSRDWPVIQAHIIAREVAALVLARLLPVPPASAQGL